MSFNNRSVTVIIPAHNEAPCIAQVVSELKELRSPDNLANPLIDDLIVCNNGSKDATACLLYTSPSPRDKRQSRMPSSA